MLSTKKRDANNLTWSSFSSTWLSFPMKSSRNAISKFMDGQESSNTTCKNTKINGKETDNGSIKMVILRRHMPNSLVQNKQMIKITKQKRQITGKDLQNSMIRKLLKKSKKWSPLTDYPT